jgi:SAM-dependent methyltransferase
MGECPFCHAPTTADVWSNDPIGECRLVHCGACDITFTSPPLGETELEPFYAASYFGPVNRRFWPPLEWIVHRFRRRRAKRLHALAGRPGRALDIGCGRGVTLFHLRELGWEVAGIERSPTAAEHARDELDLDVDTAGFDPKRYASEQYDLVILWHVLEHLTEPLEALAGIARMIPPGGILAVSVPNLDSWQAGLSHYGWFHLDLPRHRVHFTAAGLKRRLEALGFHVVRESHASLEQNVFGWLQSVLNRLGFEPNLLYDLLRSPRARRIKQPWRTHPLQSLASVLIGSMLLLPALAMLPLEQLFRRGATVDLYAVRKGTE